jgi:hypothetical protein
MNGRFVAPTALRLVAGAILALAAAPAFAQVTKAPSGSSEEWSQPRTPWGDPDLQGTWTSDNCIRTPMNRPVEFGDRLYFTAEEIAKREAAIEAQKVNDLKETAAGQTIHTGPPPHWREGARKPCGQTSLVVDPPNGRVPDMLPEAKTRIIPQAATIENPRADTWEDFQHYIRCITRGVTGSIFPVIYGNGQQVVQGPGYVMILQEMVHEARLIPLDGRPHAGAGVRSYMGDARGRWEGDTLVVDTTNFSEQSIYRGSAERLHLVERFTRADADTLTYQVTIDDPSTFTKPWTIVFPVTKSAGALYEYACHEGNYGMFNLLSGSRSAEQAEADAAKKGSN